MIYTGEDYVLNDQIAALTHPTSAAATSDISSADLGNLQRNILTYGADQVCLSALLYRDCSSNHGNHTQRSTDDKEEEACFKFTKPNPNDVFLNESTRPGALPEVYLEDLKHKTR